MRPLRVLMDEAPVGVGQPSEALAELYGGGLELPAELLYANFVSSLDGVVALDQPAGGGPATIALHSVADRFVMGLLRLEADAVLLGAGTLRDGWNHHWTPEHICPEAADLYRELGRSTPELVVVTLSGHLDPAQPALADRTLVLTTDRGRERLAGRLPGASRLRSLGADAPTGRQLVEAIRAEGHRRILTEGGPMVIGILLRDRVLDELFLTLSPVLAGRERGDRHRLSLAEGAALPPDRFATGTLRSLRQDADHLFLRYRFTPR